MVGATGVLNPGRRTQTIAEHNYKCFVEAWRDIIGDNSS
jgi:hypothetical protein